MPIGFGVIGLGNWGEAHAKTYAYEPNADLVCVCDIVEARAKEVGEKYGSKCVCTDYRRLLEHDDIQAVSIVTPDFAHTDIAVAAAEAGKHILIEKPLATTVEDCERILAAVEKAGVTLMVDFHNRWNPAFFKMKTSIEKGEMGEVQFIFLRLNDTIWVPTTMLSWAAKSNVAWFLASHCIDLVRWFTGDEVAKVYSVASSRVLKGMGIDTPDFFQTTLTMRGGAVASIETCWIMSEGYPTIFDFKAELVGSKGMMMADLSTHRALQRFTAQNRTEFPDLIVAPEIHGKPVGFAIESIRYFVDCVAGGRQPLVGGHDGLQATKVICAMLESAQTGQAVSLR
jgi:predicted dehydrogenase